MVPKIAQMGSTAFTVLTREPKRTLTLVGSTTLGSGILSLVLSTALGSWKGSAWSAETASECCP
eukprot:3662657-Heterocapsa_arctica.AAC.1